MTKVDVALPEDARSYVEKQVASGRYESVGAYLLELVDRDRRRALRSEFEAQLVSALQSSQQKGQ